MTQQPTDWTIAFYQDAAGNSPVEDFLNTLDKRALADLVWAIRELKERNINAREPLVKPIEGKLWELRTTSDGNAYRLLYFFFSGRRIVFLNGFQKKTEKAPRREIDTAISRMNDYIARKGGK